MGKVRENEEDLARWKNGFTSSWIAFSVFRRELRVASRPEGLFCGAQHPCTFWRDFRCPPSRQSAGTLPRSRAPRTDPARSPEMSYESVRILFERYTPPHFALLCAACARARSLTSRLPLSRCVGRKLQHTPATIMCNHHIIHTYCCCASYGLFITNFFLPPSFSFSFFLFLLFSFLFFFCFVL